MEILWIPSFRISPLIFITCPFQLQRILTILDPPSPCQVLTAFNKEVEAVSDPRMVMESRQDTQCLQNCLQLFAFILLEFWINSLDPQNLAVNWKDFSIIFSECAISWSNFDVHFASHSWGGVGAGPTASKLTSCRWKWVNPIWTRRSMGCQEWTHLMRSGLGMGIDYVTIAGILKLSWTLSMAPFQGLQAADPTGVRWAEDCEKGFGMARWERLERWLCRYFLMLGTTPNAVRTPYYWGMQPWMKRSATEMSDGLFKKRAVKQSHTFSAILRDNRSRAPRFSPSSCCVPQVRHFKTILSLQSVWEAGWGDFFISTYLRSNILQSETVHRFLMLSVGVVITRAATKCDHRTSDSRGLKSILGRELQISPSIAAAMTTIATIPILKRHIESLHDAFTSSVMNHSGKCSPAFVSILEWIEHETTWTHTNQSRNHPNSRPIEIGSRWFPMFRYVSISGTPHRPWKLRLGSTATLPRHSAGSCALAESQGPAPRQMVVDEMGEITELQRTASCS